MVRRPNPDGPGDTGGEEPGVDAPIPAADPGREEADAADVAAARGSSRADGARGGLPAAIDGVGPEDAGTGAATGASETGRAEEDAGAEDAVGRGAGATAGAGAGAGASRSTRWTWRSVRRSMSCAKGREEKGGNRLGGRRGRRKSRRRGAPSCCRPRTFPRRSSAMMSAHLAMMLSARSATLVSGFRPFSRILRTGAKGGAKARTAQHIVYFEHDTEPVFECWRRMRRARDAAPRSGDAWWSRRRRWPQRPSRTVSCAAAFGA